jgi:ADP-ribose pyrophosphatase YjhB (NUDIX family)
MRQAAVMLIVKDGLILAVSRRHDSTKFGLPGGKQEPNETLSEAAIRETFEETGVKVYTCSRLYVREEPASHPGGEPFYTTAFYAMDWDGDPVASEEGVVKWITASDLTNSSGAFSEYNRATLDAMKKLLPSVYIKGE